jgi:nucleotide-binding universal stress UspA family protein
MEKLRRDGPSVPTILKTAQELKADLIVMGTHGRTGIGRLFLGSVAEEVIRKAPCPVMTVKADKPAPDGKARAASRPEPAVGG